MDKDEITELKREAIKNSDMSDEEKARELLATVEVPKQGGNKKLRGWLIFAGLLIVLSLAWLVVKNFLPTS